MSQEAKVLSSINSKTPTDKKYSEVVSRLEVGLTMRTSRSAGWCYDYLKIKNMATHFLCLLIFQYIEDYVHLDNHALAKHREPISDCAALAVVPAIGVES